LPRHRFPNPDFETEVPPRSENRPSEAGDNPNKNNAKPRKNYRPKSKNGNPPTPPQDSQGKIIFAEPDLHAPPLSEVKIERLKYVATPNAGEITLKIRLPLTIVDPFQDLVDQVAHRNLYFDPQMIQARTLLTAQAFFKAARQLYATMEPVDMSVLQPLKSVYYDNAEVPEKLAHALGLIGTFDTLIGRFGIKHSATLFLRWIAEGLNISHEMLGIQALVMDCEKLVWPVQDSVDLIVQKAKDQLREEILGTSAELTLADGTTIFVSPEYIDPSVPDYDPVGYHDRISDTWMNAQRMRNLVMLTTVNRTNLQNGVLSFGTLGNVPVDDLLLEIDLFRANGNGYDFNNMRDSFANFQVVYQRVAIPKLVTIFKMTAPTTSDNGSDAQLVSANSYTANARFPVSDSGLAFGYMFDPSQAVDYNGDMQARGQVTRENMTVQYAQSSVLTFAG